MVTQSRGRREVGLGFFFKETRGEKKGGEVVEASNEFGRIEEW